MGSRPGKRPRGWTKCPKLRAAYEEGGVAIGRMMVWQPERAEQIWKLVGGTGIWPKWYLEGFRYHWIKDNPREYNQWRRSVTNGRASQRRKAQKLQEAKDQGFGVLDSRALG